MGVDYFLNEFIKELQGILGIIVITIGLFLIKIVREFLIKMIKNLWKMIRKPSSFKDSVNLNRYVSDAIVELRTKATADRAWVFEFSNGQTFSAKNPIWRISRTYEKCASGINYEHKKLQSVLVSTVFELVECFINGSTKTSGILKIDCNNCPNKCFRHSFVFNVRQMPHIAERQMLDEQGVKISIQTNLTNSIGETIGILGVDFCDELSQTMYSEKDETEMINVCKILTGYAEKISFKLANFRH